MLGGECLDRSEIIRARAVRARPILSLQPTTLVRSTLGFLIDPVHRRPRTDIDRHLNLDGGIDITDAACRRGQSLYRFR